MDKTRAKRLANTLKGKVCAGWAIEEYINCGKSAIVMRARKGDTLGAVKFFDPELVEKYGAEIQEERIDREKGLIGQFHPNLVQIYDGGFWKQRKLHYIVMEFLPWKNLAEVLNVVPTGKERDIISQVSSAVQFLEGLKICHRDIKPENIAISPDFQKVKLLDLGVIRPHGTKSITVGTSGKVFVGTLKYSPPEFLLGTEEDSLNGWRALSFYQLGGVLHDLIMRRSLFSGYENPFAVLVNAVQHTKPEIDSNSISPALVTLAGNCLLKKAELRLQLVTWDDFHNEPEIEDSVAEIKSRITKRQLAKDDDTSAKPMLPDADKRIEEYTQSLLSTCRLECVDNRQIWPPIEIHSNRSGTKEVITSHFDPSNTHGLHNHLTIQISVEWLDPEHDVVELNLAGCVSSNELPKGAPILKAAVSVFKGVFAAEAARKAILPVFYRALDAALKGKKLTKSDPGPHELELLKDSP